MSLKEKGKSCSLITSGLTPFDFTVLAIDELKSHLFLVHFSV